MGSYRLPHWLRVFSSTTRQGKNLEEQVESLELHHHLKLENDSGVGRRKGDATRVPMLVGLHRKHCSLRTKPQWPQGRSPKGHRCSCWEQRRFRFRCGSKVRTKMVKVGSALFCIEHEKSALPREQEMEYHRNKCIKSVRVVFHHFQWSPCHIIFSNLHYNSRKY